METISLKLDNILLNEMDQKLSRYRYSTRTEFIRDAIREKLSDLDKENILKELAKLRGFSKRKTSDEDLHTARERAFEELKNKLK